KDSFNYKFYPLILNLLKEEQASAKNLLQLALSRLSLSVAKSRESIVLSVDSSQLLINSVI
ncbi:hypothetical protein, partial [Limosilactobacillus reuteri]|uniref:hypothetical protein n=1 Tax=Limosilactobacillus reuteri TaxID=1598 RepID=UPI001CDB25A1